MYSITETFFGQFRRGFAQIPRHAAVPPALRLNQARG
jgi:hypothetical protein